MVSINEITKQLQEIDDEEAGKLLNSLNLNELSKIEKLAVDIAYCRDSCYFLGIDYNNPSIPKLRLAAYLIMQD